MKKKEIEFLIDLGRFKGYLFFKKKCYIYDEDIAYFYNKDPEGWYIVNRKLHELIIGREKKEDMLKLIPKHQESIKKMKENNTYQFEIIIQEKILELIKKQFLQMQKGEEL